MSPELTTIAFIGLGAMGAPMAGQLANAGFRLRLHDRDRHLAERVGADLPARLDICTGAREAAEGADAVVTMLPDGEIVRSVAREMAPALRHGALFVDMSSSAPADVRALSDFLAGHAVATVDAPVSGGVPKAADGTLSILVGGSDENVALARPMLETMGSRIFHCGAVGSGAAMKALNNLLSAAGLAAMVEVLAAGKRFGLDPSVMVDVLNASTGRNNSTELKAKQHILSGRFGTGFAYDLMVKDIANALRLDETGGSQMPVCRATVEQWWRSRSLLDDGADHTEIARAHARATGVSLAED